MLHTTAPLQISREIATFSAEAMYRHPHITYRAFERFIGSLKSSFRHGTVGPLSKAKMVRHLTIFPSPPVPASAHSQYGETHKASATNKDTIHQFLPELLRSFTSLDSLTVRDALFTTWKDWVTFQKALSQVKPQKAQLELSLWDLTHSASGLELRAATTHSVHADFNNDVFVSHKDIEDTLNRDRPFSSPAIPHFQVMLETWKAALTSGGEMIMPLHWIDPKRKTPDPTPETAPVVSLGGTSNSDDESDVAEPRTMVDITPNPDMEDYEIIIPASAVNRLRAYTAGWSSTGTSLNTFRTSFASPASDIDDQAGSSAIDMSDYLPLPFTGVPGVTLEWGALRMRRGDPVVEVALSAYQFIANTGFAAESGSSAIQQATTWASGSSLTLDDATISAIPIREEGEDMDWSDEFGYLYGILGEGSLNTPFLEPQVVPSAPDVPPQESFVVFHDWAGISGMDQAFPDSTSLFTTSPLFNPPPPAHGSQRLALAYTSAVHPGSTRTRTALASSTPTPSPGSGDYAHEARAGLLQLLKGWSPRLQALSLVLLDPAAGIMVRAPDLDFWRELDIPHIRVRLPRGCTALSVLQGSSEYRRSLRRRQELVGHFNRDPYAGVSTVTGPAHNGHANHNNFGAFLLSLASNTLTTQEMELRQSKDTGTEQTVYIGHGVLHPNNLLFEIEVNTHAEMQDEMWYECGGQMPSQVCRLLVGEQDWRDVDITSEFVVVPDHMSRC